MGLTGYDRSFWYALFTEKLRTGIQKLRSNKDESPLIWFLYSLQNTFSKPEKACISDQFEKKLPLSHTFYHYWMTVSDQCNQPVCLPEFCICITDCSKKVSGFQFDQLLSSVFKLLVTVKHRRRCASCHTEHTLSCQYALLLQAFPREKSKLQKYTHWGEKGEKRARAANSTSS